MIQQYCTQCGARLPETGAFCPECGAHTQRQALPPATNTTAVPAAPAPLPAAPSTPRTTRRPLFLAVSLLTVALVLGAAVYFVAIRPRQSPAIVEPCVAGENCAGTAIADVHDEEGIPYPDVQRITVADARARYDAGQATFVDVRDAEAYAAAHIPESLSMPLAELEAGIHPLPRDAEIITYCT
jgi:hypothetical protein